MKVQGVQLMHKKQCIYSSKHLIKSEHALTEKRSLSERSILARDEADPNKPYIQAPKCCDI